MNKVKKAYGFTLTELMVTIGLMAVMLTLSMPSLQEYTRKTRLVLAAETLYQQTQVAREQALKRQANVFIRFITTRNWCVGYNVGDTFCDCTVPNDCNLSVLDSTQFPNTTLSVQNTNWRFEGNRGTTLSGGTATLSSTNNIAISLKTKRLGHLQLCSSTVKGFKAC